MNALHPLAWLGIGTSLAAVAWTTTNWLVSLLALACTVLLSLTGPGERIRAFSWALAAGGCGLAVQVALGALVGGVPDDPTILAFLPERSLGQGVTIGGPYTVEQLAISVERGLDVWVLAAVAGLLWQACPGGRWCDLAQTFVGRGAHLVAPGAFVGESLIRTGPGPGPVGRLAAMAEVDRQLCDAWRTHARPAPPNWVHALVASVLGSALAAGLFWLSWRGGLPVRTSAERVVTVTARPLLGVVAGLWCLVRFALGPRPEPGLGGADVAALGGCAVVLLGRWVGDSSALVADPGRWPPLPPVLSVTLAAALAVWIASASATARSRP